MEDEEIKLAVIGVPRESAPGVTTSENALIGAVLNILAGILYGAIIAGPLAFVVMKFVVDAHEKELKENFITEIRPYWDSINQIDKEIQELKKSKYAAIEHFQETIQKTANEMDTKQGHPDAITLAKALVSERDKIRSSIDEISNGLISEFSPLGKELSQNNPDADKVSKLVNEAASSWAKKKKTILPNLKTLKGE